METFAEATAHIGQNKPNLLRSFLDIHRLLGGNETPDSPAGIALHLALAGEFVFIQHRTILMSLERRDAQNFADITYAFSLSSVACAAGFVDRYPAMTFPLNGVYKELRRFAVSNLRAVDSPEKMLKMALESEDIDGALVYLNLFIGMIDVSPKSTTDFLNSFDTVRRRLPQAVLLNWLNRGADLLSSSRIEAGIRHLLIRSRESRSLLGITAGVLDDVQRVLQIYAARCWQD